MKNYNVVVENLKYTMRAIRVLEDPAKVVKNMSRTNKMLINIITTLLENSKSDCNTCNTLYIATSKSEYLLWVPHHINIVNVYDVIYDVLKICKDITTCKTVKLLIDVIPTVMSTNNSTDKDFIPTVMSTNNSTDKDFICTFKASVPPLNNFMASESRRMMEAWMTGIKDPSGEYTHPPKGYDGLI